MTNFQNNIIESGGFSRLNYNADSEYRSSFLLKYQIPGKNFRVKSGFNYSSIKGSGVIETTNPSANSIPINVDTESELRTIILGFEYVNKDSLFTPYIGMDLLVGIFKDVDIYRQDKSGEIINEIYPSKSKIGLALNCGVGYKLIPGMELDVNLMYGSLNVLGKEDFENNIETIDLTVSVLFAL